MRAQGCEYQLYRDTFAVEPRFFERVEQIAMEVHLSRLWAPNDATFLEYGRYLGLLRRAGFELYDVSLGFCSGGEPMGLATFLEVSADCFEAALNSVKNTPNKKANWPLRSI